MSKLICWDLEIKTPVSETGLGWEAARRGDCGVSVLALSDSETGRYHLYDEHTLDQAIDHLNSADLLIGYNTLNFDTEVLWGITGRYITVPQYDILAEIWKALPRKQKGYKLDEVARATIGIGKSGTGEFAPTLVVQQRWAELMDYCIADVDLCRKLFNHITDLGWIKGADGEELDIATPPIKDYA